ncbi:MAG: ABC transporter ATP-binding protein, partial [Acidobacteria bacterium]|nr:ABC transporter ATP-binding protein [Acidobacteriota bacterium]
MLTIDKVSKVYSTPRGDLPILDGVSLTLERG